MDLFLHGEEEINFSISLFGRFYILKSLISVIIYVKIDLGFIQNYYVYSENLIF